jgi:hypothetical protein
MPFAPRVYLPVRSPLASAAHATTLMPVQVEVVGPQPPQRLVQAGEEDAYRY